MTNIHTDLLYAFTTLHVHGREDYTRREDSLYKERGLLVARGREIKNQERIPKLLRAVWEPREVAVIYCKGHQRGKGSVSEGNRWADAAAKQAAERQTTPSKIMLVQELPTSWICERHTIQETKWAQQEKGSQTKDGWWILPDQRVYTRAASPPSGSPTA